MNPLSLITGAECPSCGRDNSGDLGDVCMSEDCPGVQIYSVDLGTIYRAARRLLTPEQCATLNPEEEAAFGRVETALGE